MSQVLNDATPVAPVLLTPAEERAGYFYGIGAYVAWALFPLYFTSVVGNVSPLHVLANRIVWSLVFLTIVISWQRRWPAVLQHVKTRRIQLLLLGSAIAIAFNWYSFIWAMTNGQILQASLGYFMNPLLATALGVFVLGERLRKMQSLAVTIAAVSVAIFIVAQHVVPVVALVVGLSFALYGLLRKIAVVPPIIGLWIETAILLPPALVVLGLQIYAHQTSLQTYGLLTVAGPLTALPLIWFAAAARRLKLSTIGFLQYISPTGHFLLGRLVYKEPFNHIEFGCFIAIWIALAIFTVDQIWTFRRRGRVEG